MCCMMHGMDHSEHEKQTQASTTTQSESLMEILKRRYAQGELSLAQFEEMKRVLELSDKPSAVTTNNHTHH